MKRLSMFLLTVLLIASLFVSCDTNTNAVLDEHVTVSFSTGADGRSLGYEIENISNLKWHYSATKTNPNDAFRFGETDGKPLTSFDTKIELSQGKWDFKLWANKVVNESETEVKVYEGSVTGVLITKETSPKSIVINVSPEVANVKGSIKFDGVQVSLKATNASTPSTPVYAKTATIADVDGDINLVNGTAIKDNLTPGDYVVTVKYTEVVDGTTVTYASETIVVTVWSGRTTTISGNVSEETGSAIIDGNIQVPTQATVTKTAASGQTTVFTANVAPANNKESSKMESTTAVFEADALDNNASYSLSVAVTNDVENGNINIEATSGIAATLNLSLKNGETVVSSFNEKSVTITTYIAKGLGNNNVSVTGPEEATITDVSYDSDTGKLVFTTNHFSEYKVKVNENTSYEAYNVTLNRVYTSLDDAVTNAEAGNTVVLLKDVNRDKQNADDSGALSFEKSIVFDGAGHKMILNTATRGIWIDADNVEAVIKNLTIDGRTSGKGERAVQVNNDIKNAKLTIENCDLSATMYTINIANRAEVDLNISDSTITGWGAINLWSATYNVTVNDSTLIGINDKTYDADGWNGFGTVVLEGDTTNKTDMGADGLTVSISNSVIDTRSTTGNIQKAILFNAHSRKNIVNIVNTEFKYNATGDHSEAILYVDNGIENQLNINGELKNSPVYAAMSLS